MRVPHAFLSWRHVITGGAIAAIAIAGAGLHAQTRARAVPAKSNPVASVRSITRTPLPRGERITIELSAEVRYSGDRVPNPDRVYFDFQHANAAAAVVASAKSLPSGELVSGIRLGQFTSDSARLVLDLTGRPRFSAFPMYSPFRLVIDVEAEPAAGATSETPAPIRSQPAPVYEPAPRAPAIPVAVNAERFVAPASSESAYPVVESPVPPAPPAPPPTLSKPAAPVQSVAAKVSAVPLSVPPPAPVARPTIPAGPPPVAAAALSRGRDYSLARQLGLGIARIVIDPGHGGHDPGAKGQGVMEAELVLDLALRLEKLLKEQQGVEVVLTRRTDEFIPLEERTAIANREGADLFLSIHANASTRAAARGIETYFLNFATDPEAEAVAARENAASGRNMGRLPDLVKTIALNDKVVESRELANIVQASMFRRLKTQNKTLRDLGVKQAPFVVLIGAEMPSVLAEVSFVTNKTEGSLLKKEAYRQSIAQSLADGVLRYQSSLKRRPAPATKRAEAR